MSQSIRTPFDLENYFATSTGCEDLSLIFAVCKLQQGLPFVFSIELRTVAVAAPSLVALWHLLPWLYDYYGIRGVPGHFFAKFSDLWLALIAMSGHRSEAIHQLHLKYGTFVRLAPNHVSIADPDALSLVYGHGHGTLKSPYYDAFVSIHRSIFTTRDRVDHSRKRKIVSHVFSSKSVIEFEPHLRRDIGTLIEQWDRLCEAALEGGSGPEGEGWRGERGYLFFNLVPWTNYLSFDIIGDLSFGAPFHMLTSARDAAQVPKDQSDVMEAYGSKEAKVEVLDIPAIKTLHGRGNYTATMGCFPGYWRPIIRLIPWFRRGSTDEEHLAGIAIMAVMKRFNSPPTDRVDLLSKLQEGKDSEGKPMGREELTAEALAFMTAGSDTMSNSTCAIIYHLAHNPVVQRKLQALLDDHLGSEDIAVVTADQVKNLPYLDACIKEGQRLHSTSSLGLPRVVPVGGLHISGRFFPAGAVVSVPSYTIHRDKSVWGEDVEEYRPERWEQGCQKAMMSAFNAFSLGPRGCVGKNLAVVELQMIIGSLFRRYDFILMNPNQPLKTEEGFIRKPLECEVGIRGRMFRA